MLATALLWTAPSLAADNGRAPWVVGSTLMNPMTVEVFKRLKERTPTLPAPRIDAQGTSKGIQAFCAGADADTPDIVAMSRRMRGVEFDQCAKNKVGDIIEMQVGNEALVLAVSVRDEDFHLTFDTLYKAVAAELPEGDEFLPNMKRTWNDIDKTLPKTEIQVIVPSSALGARGFFENRFLQGACREMSAFKNIFEAGERVRQCIGLRRDGRVIELGVPYDVDVVKAMEKAPRGTVAVMPLRFALAAAGKVKILRFESVVATRETVGNRDYIGIREIYYYVKRAHVKDYTGAGPVAGLREFITEITRETTVGPDGYLTHVGLVPMSERRRGAVRNSALSLQPMIR